MTIARLPAALFAMLAAASLAFAEPPAARAYSQAELDQMLAPVALYPDPLLSQVLMAATYPLEIAEAARWSRANPGLQGDDAVRAARIENWDPSVKSLLAFPQLLQRMSDSPEWTRVLGDAFLAQEPQVMDTVQQLRRRAQAAGNLQSGEQLYVQQQGDAILLQPASPQYAYLPYYDPWLVYGAWWWPAYPPVAWAPWPGYARAYRPGVHVSFWWGAPVGLGAGFFFGDFDWHRRHARVAHPTAYYYRPPLVLNRAAAPDRWQHDPSHRLNVTYRDPRVAQRLAAFQPRRPEELRRAEAARPAERHLVLSAPQAQVHHERRAQMPAAVAPQHPRAENHAPRREPRNERGDKGKGRS